jgi:NTP pyrophosphatase (non-canonical NTP hydrolase)
MNPKLLDYIQALSKRDKKTLSQKALKVSEESGELAKAVLPYDSAYATRHRFVDKTKILEEVADTILASISVAYDLGFSHEEIEEMIDFKSEKWQKLQVAEDKVQFPLPFEIHITVSDKDGEIDEKFIEDFKKSCEELNVKPISLDLENKSGERIKDVMTSSKFYGDNRTVYEEIERITLGLEYRNFKVVRKKVETVPWHPGAPTKGNDKMPNNCYFEAHIGCIISADEKDKLSKFAKTYNAHLSKNAFKNIEDGKFVNMVTLRNYKCTNEYFENEVSHFRGELVREGFHLEKIITEFCIYDTKISHDYLWLK